LETEIGKMRGVVMERQKLWEELNSLPMEAQQQAVDFIAFLKQRYGNTSGKTRRKTVDLSEEKFIGMWSDREDMEDSSAWVRDVRKCEWRLL